MPVFSFVKIIFIFRHPEQLFYVCTKLCVRLLCEESRAASEIIWIRNVNGRLYKLDKNILNSLWNRRTLESIVSGLPVRVEQKDFGVHRKWTASALFYFIIIIIIIIIINCK